VKERCKKKEGRQGGKEKYGRFASTTFEGGKKDSLGHKEREKLAEGDEKPAGGWGKGRGKKKKKNRP